MTSRWAVLISGRGSNLSSLLDHQDEFQISLVVSSSPTAGGLWKARRAGVATALVPLLAGSKKIDWENLSVLLREKRVTHICLAGFMKIVPPSFVKDWQGRLINLHPSLLPAYPGLESIEKAHADGQDLGVSVHFVSEDVDAGKIISQRRCLKKTEVRRYSLGLAEFIVHVAEQRLLGAAVRFLQTSDRIRK